MTSTMALMNDRHIQKPYPLRMPDDLRQRLEQAAKEGGRSLNSEVTGRLESSFSREVGFAQSLYVGALAVLCRRMVELLGQDGLGVSGEEFSEVNRVLSKRVHNEKATKDEISELIAVAGLLGALPTIGAKGASKSEAPLQPTRANPAPSKKTPEGAIQHPEGPSQTEDPSPKKPAVKYIKRLPSKKP